MDKSYRILVIDDEKVVLDSCTAILANSGYEIATASDGMLGLDLIREFQPDLVFVDLKMPGLSGMDVVERINEIDPTITNIVITGFATVSSAVEAMKREPMTFCQNPLHLMNLD